MHILGNTCLRLEKSANVAFGVNSGQSFLIRVRFKKHGHK